MRRVQANRRIRPAGIAVGAFVTLAVTGALPLPVAAAPAVVPAAAGVTPVTETLIPLADASKEDGDGGWSGVVDLPGGTDMVALTWTGDPHGEVELRSRAADGTWSPWIDVHSNPEEAPDPGTEGTGGTGEGAVDPVWIGGDRAVEARVVGAEDDLLLHALAVGDAPAVAASATAAAVDRPDIHSRAEWGAAPWASTTEGCGTAPRSVRPRYLIVHHTVNINTYAPEDVPAMLRGIQQFHQEGRDFCDIAYNFIVDRFGGMWEARSGGVSEGVIGGHSANHNTGSIGISVLGDHSIAALPAAAQNAVAELAGWKSAVHFLDPVGSTTVDGGPMRVIIGHRNVVNTACPGEFAYSRLAQIRTQSEAARLRYAASWTGLAADYVNAAYQLFLGRNADPAGLQHYVGVVIGPSPARSIFTDELAHSNEWINVSLEYLYQTAFGRSGDPQGMQNWADNIRGGMRLSEVGARFYGSGEYYARSGGTPESFVRALYNALLGREADQEGIAYWTGRLESGEATTNDLAAGFYASIESRMGRVATLYQAVLGRATDPVGQSYWAGRLLQIDDVVLAAFLAASDEYVRAS